MKKVLLDTNAFISYLTADENVLASLARADMVYISVFVLGELYAGFKASGKARENKRILERFLDKPKVRVLEASRETAEVFGEIKDSLLRKGLPIPVNDIWKAAHAVEAGAVLVTYDAHFGAVPGLRIWDELTLPPD
jgi:tRNA(fMet)-specific endonuclease VapC